MGATLFDWMIGIVWLLTLVHGAVSSHSIAGARFEPANVVEERSTYVVTGADINELRVDLARRRGADGSHGYTHSEIEAHYRLEQDVHSCRLVSIEIVLRVNTTLPEWRPRRPVSPLVRKRWEAMYTALVAHEKVHEDNAREAVSSLGAELAALPMSAICKDTEWAVRRSLQRASFRLRLKDQRFDHATRNGALEGVTF